MNYKKLGNTDLDVSTICLGTMTWGEQNTQDEGFEQMDYALDQGVNFWDTAEIYSIPPREETFGSTEEIIGNWFEKTKKRNKVILATKVCGPMREYVRGGGNQFGKKNKQCQRAIQSHTAPADRPRTCYSYNRADRQWCPAQTQAGRRCRW